MYAVFSSGASSLKTLRWSLKSPKRFLFLGVLAALFLVYELLVLLGVIEYMKEVWVYTISYMVTAKDAFVESSEIVQEWVAYLWEWKEWAQKLMALQRWLAVFLALTLLTVWAAHEWSDSGEHGESSIGSSTASSVDCLRASAFAAAWLPFGWGGRGVGEPAERSRGVPEGHDGEDQRDQGRQEVEGAASRCARIFSGLPRPRGRRGQRAGDRGCDRPSGP
eukprot:3152874-Pyramimonas_sp.AAC.1